MQTRRRTTAHDRLMAVATLAGRLATSFAYPDSQLAGEIGTTRFTEGLTEGARDAGLVESVDRLQEALEEVVAADLETVQGEHTFLFARNVICPLNASAYEYQQGLQSTRRLGDVASFYGAFGYAVSNKAHELADHLTVELEFMGVLSAREEYARAHGWLSRARLCRHARATFAEEQLLTWVPTLGRRLEERARMKIYPALCASAIELVTICAGASQKDAA